MLFLILESDVSWLMKIATELTRVPPSSPVLPFSSIMYAFIEVRGFIGNVLTLHRDYKLCLNTTDDRHSSEFSAVRLSK